MSKHKPGVQRPIKKRLKGIISLAVVFAMMAAVAIRRDATLFGHRLGETATDSITAITRLEDGSAIVNTTTLGKDIRGYGGAVPLEIRVDPSGTITKITVLGNSETPKFLQRVLDGGLLAHWNGKKAEAVLNEPDVDAVSGATYTSTAIIANVRAGLSALCNREYTAPKNTARPEDFHHATPNADTVSASTQAKAEPTYNAEKAEVTHKDAGQATEPSAAPHDFTVNTTESGSGIQGFAGPVPVTMDVTAKGIITAIKPLPNDETPGFFRRVTNAALTDTFVGMSVRQALSADMPDAVSGATYSSKALIANMRLAFEQAWDTLGSFGKRTPAAATASKAVSATGGKIETRQTPEAAKPAAKATNAAVTSQDTAAKPTVTAHTEVAQTEVAAKEDSSQSGTADTAPKAATTPWLWQLVLALCFAIFATLAPLWLKGRRWRIVQLSLNVAVLGLLCGKFLSFSLMTNILSNGLQWGTGLAALVMLFAAFLMPLFGRPNHYCMWVCPYGAAQELMGHLRKGKWRPNARTTRILTWIRRLLWATLMVLMWCGAAFVWMDYEPFAIFIPTAASVAVIAIAGGFLVLSTFVRRPYCTWVCPTGTTFRAAQDITKP